MDDWELVDAFAQYHPRWFESADVYEPSTEHVAVYMSTHPSGWTIERRGIWYRVAPPNARTPDQGWKLHISARHDESVDVLRIALEILAKEDVGFKFIIDSEILKRVNGKLWPRGASGKFITIYPRDLAQFARLAGRLASALHGYGGPYILSDRRWPGSEAVFYRYGGFRPRWILSPDGTRSLAIAAPDGMLIDDVRNPYWSPPDWADDPVPAVRAGTEPLALCGGRYLVAKALRFSARGGVYVAHDRWTQTDVVIKEARPNINVGLAAIDSIELLTKEARILDRLADIPQYVNLVDYFEEDGHAFLVEERLEGEHLGRYTARHNPIYRASQSGSDVAKYLHRMYPLWAELAGAVAAAHARGVILGDLSFTNVLVTGDDRLRLIDLECAIEEGRDRAVGLHTPGLASDRARRDGITDRENDTYALGALVFGSLFLTNSFWELHPPARTRILEEISSDLLLPTGLTHVIRRLMRLPPDDSKNCSAAQAARYLRLESVGLGSDWGSIALAQSDDGQRAEFMPGVELTSEVSQVISGICDYIVGVARPDRTDRLFPADPTVFATNPLSVAYGAAGAVLALHTICKEVPVELSRWFTNRPVLPDVVPPGLYLGASGIAWVLLETGHDDVAVKLMQRTRQHPLLLQVANVMYGAAGYGLAALHFWSRGFGVEFLDEADRVARYLLRTAQSSARGVYWYDENDEVALGYAYGGAGVSLFLLYASLACGESEYYAHGKAALDFELSHAVRDETDALLGFPAFSAVTDDSSPSGAPARCYWDAGTAGVLTTLIRYWSVRPDAAMTNWIPDLARDVSHKYAVFPQLFHGLAGLGNSLIDVWRFSGDPYYLASAWRVAQGIMMFAMDRPEGVAYPSEQSRRESADYATGAAGVGLFLHRLQHALEHDANFNFVVDSLLPEVLGASRIRARGESIAIST